MDGLSLSPRAIWKEMTTEYFPVTYHELKNLFPKRNVGMKYIAAALTSVLVLVGGCTVSEVNRNPIGETFPTVTGESLNGNTVEIPLALIGEPSILMVGYIQQTQFDLDRWILGLVQAGAKIKILEVPAIPASFPSIFLRGTIDNGMRKGIPSEDWGTVVTLYGSDAWKISKFTGTENPRNGRILLLDKNGVVRWFWDQGYSATRVSQLVDESKKLETPKSDS